MSKVLIFILMPGILILSVLAIMMLNLGEKVANNNNSSSPTSPVGTEATATQTQETGIIEGSLSFPSEIIPANMMVCAETFDGKIIECTNKHLVDPKYTYGEGYTLEVPAEEYFVYAQTPELENYKAYYSEFVVCGLSVNCDSHEKIEVVVEAGKTTSNIDPQDWYNIPTP